LDEINLVNLSKKFKQWTPQLQPRRRSWTWRMKRKGTAERDKRWIYAQPDYMMAQETGIMQTFRNVGIRSPI